MFQLTETTTLVLLIGAGSVAFGAFNQLAKWGIESVKARKEPLPRPFPRNGNSRGFTPECEVLLKQTHGLAISTDRKLEATGILLEERLGALIDLGRDQIQATRDLGEKFEERPSRRE